MAKLLVRKLGTEFAQIDLVVGQEYSIGRAATCSLQLEETKGISRQHLRVYHQDGVWIVELLSRYGTLIFEGQNADAIELADQVSFSIPPYEFLFVDRVVETAPTDEPVVEEKSLVAQRPTQLTPMASGFQSMGIGSGAVGESTSAGLTNLVPYLKLSFPDHGKDEVIKLEGHLWVAGRDPSCEIPIEDHHVSRRHFELTHTNEGFYITDMGSANGTQINGSRIPAHEPQLLQSGDRVSIMDVNIDFEVRDTQFEQRLLQATRNLPAISQQNHMMSPTGFYPGMMMPAEHAGPAVVKVDQGKMLFGKIPVNDLKKPEFYKKNKVRLAILALLPVILIGLISEDPKKVEKKDSGSTSITFENLTAEQKTAIKDSFQLATNLYVKGKYELCLSELKKLHDIIPHYENSKELHTYCQQGSFLVKIEKEKAEQERKRREAEAKIVAIAEGCRLQVTETTSLPEIEACLAEAIELDPEHLRVMQVIELVQINERERKEEQDRIQARISRAASGRSKFRSAESLYKQGKLAASIKAYQSFLNGNYPSLNSEEKTAQRKLASVKKELEVKIKSLLSSCKESRNSGKYKDAYMACKQAREEDPSNKEALSEMNISESELKREMKSMYEDSILEESLGNIDAAKQKWKKIMDSDLKNGEYYSKAKRKLQKYGIGM